MWDSKCNKNTYLSEIPWTLQVPVAEMDYVEPHFSWEESTTEERFRKCFPFYQNFPPTLNFFFFLFKNKLLDLFTLPQANNLTRCTLGRLPCETIHSIRSWYLKTRGRGQLSKTKSRFFSEKDLVPCRLPMQTMTKLLLFWSGLRLMAR